APGKPARAAGAATTERPKEPVASARSGVNPHGAGDGRVRMSERKGDAAYPENWAGTPLAPAGAAARIVECIPKAFGKRGRPGSHRCRRFRRLLRRPGGSLPPPWTPASLSLFRGREEERKM